MKAINTSNGMWIYRNLIAMCVIFIFTYTFCTIIFGYIITFEGDLNIAILWRATMMQFALLFSLFAWLCYKFNIDNAILLKFSHSIIISLAFGFIFYTEMNIGSNADFYTSSIVSGFNLKYLYSQYMSVIFYSILPYIIMLPFILLYSKMYRKSRRRKDKERARNTETDDHQGLFL